MGQEKVATETVGLHVENVGGITETTVEFSPGVTVLTGRNATNRTSLLQAIMGVLGSDHATIKGDADEAYINLTAGETTYTRHFHRDNGTTITKGNPYLDDATLANLFSFLLEDNEARQAITVNDDLRDIIMRPVDTDDIESQITQLEEERSRIDDEINKIETLKQQLPELEEDKTSIESEIEDNRQELENIEEEIDSIDDDIETKREEKDELEAKLDELTDVRSQLDTVRRKLDNHQESLGALEAEREELDTDLDDYSDVPDARIDEINSEHQRLRQQLNSTETTLDDLQTVIQFNEEFLDGSLDVVSDLHNGGTENSAVTDQLLEDDEDLICWTCGSEVDTGQIETMLDRLRELRSQTMEQRSHLQAQIDELEDERIELEEQQRRYTEITTRIEDIEKEIQERKDRITELQNQQSELTEEVGELEAEVDELRTDDKSELLDLHTEANRIEMEIDRLEDDRQDVVNEIEQIQERVDQRDQIEDQRDEVQAEIEELRTHIERLEQQAVNEFNNHMEAVLEILDYDNLERIWIERTEQKVREGRQKVTKGKFDLHIVRQTESGAVYEDTAAHLSESEREVTGLVFALAGYLAHNLHEEVPFMLLDSLEALDSDRIASLIDYFQDFADYLVVALLSEDAEALDSDYERVTEI